MNRNSNQNKLIQKIDRFAPQAVRIQLLVLLIAQIVSYYGARLLTAGRRLRCMAIPLDYKIPVMPWTVVVYLAAFVFWAAAYTIILRNDDGRRLFFRAEIGGKLICGIIYLIIPTTFARPQLAGNGFFTLLLRLLYAADSPEQLFPSIHCYVSWMCVIGMRGNKKISRKCRIFTIVMAVMICLSTLTTKQHVIVDVISGILLAEVMWLIVRMSRDPRRAFMDRDGNIVKLKDSPSGILNVLYTFAAGRLLLRGFAWPGISEFTGRILSTRLSCLFNRSFVAHYGIDMSEYEPGPYKSFNDLFSRRALPGARPVNENKKTVISPCDGKVQVMRIDKNASIEVKGISYTIDSLLRDPELSEMYAGGTVMAFRLGAETYHRYAYPVDGVAGERVFLDGVLQTVSPAGSSRHPVYCENIREYSLLYTSEFGTVLMMEVGAMLVGKICNKGSAGPVRRGDEKGYFEFGASSILLIFEKDKVRVDEDLLKNTEAGYETLVKLGERVGVSML
ncbi:MAG: phosphatidylserine decarboxylase [Clostridia bacterium]|nr:phosphatidylserine decarboxylase [Clostridia bacterium]